MEISANKIPPYVSRVTETLQKSGFEAYLVGGCVRDLLMGREPKDWDVTTNANPEQIMGLFEKTFYENSFGTVGVRVENGKAGKKDVSPRLMPPVTRDSVDITNDNMTLGSPRSATPGINGVSHETLVEEEGNVTRETEGDVSYETVEITPYRLEAKYSDQRHPDSVAFSTKLEDDLKRRDFAMNALAYDPAQGQLVDLYEGKKDIKDKVVRAVGQAEERFQEDALRIVRAVRFATELGFWIEEKTKEALIKTAPSLEKISKERIRDEFVKLVMSSNPMQGIILAHDVGVLQYIVPELEKGIGVEQNGDHIYTVWEHNLRAVQHSADSNWPLHVRLSALLHDVSKPETRRWADEKKDWTFYGHDVVGGRVAKQVLSRLKFSNKMIDIVSTLVRYHLFFSDVEKITLSAVRRIVRNVGPENVWDLMKVRACDRIGMGRPKEKPYRLRKYEAMIEEAMRAPVSVGMLKVDGTKIMEITGQNPGPRLGWILHALLEEALDDPEINNDEYLGKRVKELSALSDLELKKLGEQGKDKKEEEESKEINEIRKRHWVK